MTFRRIERTLPIRSAFAEWETDIAEWETDKKSMLTETNGLKISFSVGRPLTLYGKVWLRLYTRRSSGHHRWRCNNTSPPFPVFRCPQGISKLHFRRPCLDFIFQSLLLSSSPSCSIHCFLQNCLHHARKSWDVAIPSEFPFFYVTLTSQDVCLSVTSLNDNVTWSIDLHWCMKPVGLKWFI